MRRSCAARCVSRGEPIFRCAAPVCTPPSSPGRTNRIVPAGGVARGDVVTFLLDDAVVTHRVVAAAATQVPSCRGDHSVFTDRPVAPEAILGRAVEVVGRGPLAGGPRALMLVNARRTVLGAPVKGRRLLEESALLLRQVCHRPPPVMEPTAGGIPDLSLDERWRVLQAERLLPGGDIDRQIATRGPWCPWSCRPVCSQPWRPRQRRRVLATLRAAGAGLRPAAGERRLPGAPSRPGPAVADARGCACRRARRRRGARGRKGAAGHGALLLCRRWPARWNAPAWTSGRWS